VPVAAFKKACRQGVNFFNVLCTAFVCADPKSANKTDDLIVFFCAFGIYTPESCSKTLMKLTLGWTTLVYVIFYKFGSVA